MVLQRIHSNLHLTHLHYSAKELCTILYIIVVDVTNWASFFGLCHCGLPGAIVKKQRVTIATCMHQWLAEKGTHWIQPYYVLYAIIFIIVDIISLVQLGKLFCFIMLWTRKTKRVTIPTCTHQ